MLFPADLAREVDPDRVTNCTYDRAHMGLNGSSRLLKAEALRFHGQRCGGHAEEKSSLLEMSSHGGPAGVN